MMQPRVKSFRVSEYSEPAPVVGDASGSPQCDMLMRLPIVEATSSMIAVQSADEVSEKSESALMEESEQGDFTPWTAFNVASVVWLCTMFSEPSIRAVLHYGALIVMAASISLEAASWIPVVRRWSIGIAVIASIAALTIWPNFDCYRVRQTDESGTRYVEYMTRTGKHYFRMIVTTASTTNFRTIFRGPVAGIPPVAQGHWIMLDEEKKWAKSESWFWNGDPITEAEWKQRNREKWAPPASQTDDHR